MLKRWFPVVNAGALVLLLASASTSHAQLGSFLGTGISPWSGTGGFMYAPNGMGFNYYRPGMYGGYGGYGGYGMGMMGMGMGIVPGYGYGGYGGYGMGMAPYSGYGMPSSVAMSPMSYIAYSPPVYTSRAPVVAPLGGLLPSDQPATIEVTVPTDAVILFDGHKTSQAGTHRIFTTPDLVKGNSYHYMVEATFMHNGKSVTQSQRVQVYAGARVGVAFPTTK